MEEEKKKKVTVPILAASDLIQALTLIIASFGFYPDCFITFGNQNYAQETVEHWCTQRKRIDRR